MRGEWKEFIKNRPMDKTIEDVKFTQFLLYRRWVGEWLQAVRDGGQDLHDVDHVDIIAIFREVHEILNGF